MTKFFRKHSQFLLAGLTVVFLAVLICYFFWGIQTLIVTLNGAINPGKISGTPVGFNLDEAGKLNLRGLVPPASQ